MNRQSTIFSLFGHAIIFAVIVLWGIQWPFKPREVQIDTIEVIDNASFEALVAEAKAAQSDAVEPEFTPQTVPDVVVEPAPDVVEPTPVEDIAPISEEPVEIEIIRPGPLTPPPAPTPPPPPAVPAIGAAAPRAAIAPPARPSNIGETRTATTDQNVTDVASNVEIDQLVDSVSEIVADVPPPPTRDEIGDAIEALAGALTGGAPAATPATAAPSTAPIPPARVATSLNTADVETVAPAETTDNGVATQPAPTVENAPAPAPDVAPTPDVPAAPIVSAPPIPPARIADQLNVVTQSAAAAEAGIEELLAEVAAETAPTPTPEPTPVEPAPAATNAPSTAPVPPARPANLNVSNATSVEAAPSDAEAILAALETGGTQGNSRPLSRIEVGSIIAQIQKNWSIAPIADKPNLSELIVVVGFSVDATGTLSTPIKLLDPNAPNDDQLAAFQAAERAVLTSMPLSLPSDVDPNGVDWTLTFDPASQSVGTA